MQKICGCGGKSIFRQPYWQVVIFLLVLLPIVMVLSFPPRVHRDLAAGSNPSYYRYWGLDKNKVIKVDYKEKEGVDVVANLNHDLPFKDNHADNIFLFNAIYIIEEPKNLLREIRRVLKPGGIFFFINAIFSIFN